MSQSHADRPELPRLPEPRNPSAAPANGRRELPRYQVILRHDAVQDLMLVVRSVMELLRYPRAEATHKMWQAHHCGKSVLLTTYRERAELYVEQFARLGLAVALERAD